MSRVVGEWREALELANESAAIYVMRYRVRRFCTGWRVEPAHVPVLLEADV